MTHPLIKISAYHAWVGKDGNPRPGCRPYDTDFYTEMDRIRDGHYKPIVDKCRDIQDEEERKRYKVSFLPSLTISAVCRDWRKIENVVSHTGLLNLDIDQKSNQHIEDWPALRDQIFELNGVIACFLSVSGNGVTFVVKVNPEQHKDTFFSIVDEMKQHMNISVDAGLHDVTRLRFVSHDPGCKIRYNFSEIPPIQPSVQYLQSKKDFGNYSISLEPNGEADSEYNFNEAVKRAEARFTFQDGNKWSFLVSVAGSCNVMGMSLDFCRSMVMQRFRDKTTIPDHQLIKPVDDVYKIYKSQHGTFDIQLAFENLNRKIKGVLIYDFLHEGVKPTEEDIKKICQENDANPERVYYVLDRVFGEYADEFGYKDFPMVKKVQVWLSKRWDFKFNKVTAQPEMSPKGTIVVDTVNPDEIYRQLELNRFKFNLNNVKSLMKSAFVKPYDPILDYFTGTTYDSSRDYIAELGSHVKTAEGEFWDIMFKKALVRSIACGIGKKENRIVMVLYGKKQETGKSTFIRFLSPWEDGRYFTESPIIGGNQKDTEIRFSENFIYNMEELAGLSRADVNKLKADISKSHIKERRAYAYFEASMPRRANFWGSTNLKEFLHDEENTRWLIFDVQALDWAYKANVDIHNVWGQAWQLYKDGFDFELDLADKKIREYLNQDYRYKRPEEELILRHFRPASPSTGQFYSATEIAMELNNMSSSLKINPNNIGKTISAIFELESIQAKIEGRNQRGYWLQKIFNQAEGENRFPQNPASSSRELPF